MILKLLIVILGILGLLLTVPVGADVGYKDGALRVFIRIWRVTLCVYPRKPKKDKPTKEKQAEPQPEDQAPKAKQKRSLPNVTKDEVLDAVTVAVKALMKLRLRLYRLKLHFISAFDDPYQTAVVYGYANAFAEGLGMPHWRHSDVQLGMDFERESCYVDGYVSVTVRVYYIGKLCACLICGLLPILWRRRKRMKTIEKNTAVKGKVA